MKRRTAVLIVVSVVLIVSLCFVNIYISLSMPDNKRLNQSIDERITAQIYKEINALPKPENGRDGTDGKDGVTTVVEKKITITEPSEKPVNGVNGNDGKNGIDGRDGKDGKNGRTPIFDVDEETGDVLVKYEGDTLWSLLIEGCKLRKDCEE